MECIEVGWSAPISLTQPVQELSDADRPARMAFCNWMHQQRQISILWTDEATLGRVVLFNMHNEHLWAHENSHAVLQKHFQDRFSVNVWADIIGETVISPVFLDRLNGESYLNFLRQTTSFIRRCATRFVTRHVLSTW